MKGGACVLCADGHGPLCHASPRLRARTSLHRSTCSRAYVLEQAHRSSSCLVCFFFAPAGDLRITVAVKVQTRHNCLTCLKPGLCSCVSATGTLSRSLNPDLEFLWTNIPKNVFMSCALSSQHDCRVCITSSYFCQLRCFMQHCVWPSSPTLRTYTLTTSRLPICRQPLHPFELTQAEKTSERDLLLLVPSTGDHLALQTRARS